MADTYSGVTGPLAAWMAVRDRNQQLGDRHNASLMNQQAGALSLLTGAQKLQEQQSLNGILSSKMPEGEKLSALMSGKAGALGLGLAHQMATVRAQQGQDAEAQRQRQFFSPENRARFMQPGSPGIPAIPAGVDELGGGPGAPAQSAVAPTMDMRGFAQEGIMQGIRGAEPLLNHMAQRDQAQAALAQRAADQQANRNQRIDEFAYREQMAADARREGNLNRLAQIQAAQAGRVQQEPLVPVKGPDNTIIYMPRNQAAGMEVGARPSGRASQGLSASSQNELFKTDKEIQAGEQASKFIDQALKMNDKAAGFLGAGTVSSVATLLPGAVRPKVMDKTENLKNIILNTALPQLKAVFGGAPSEGERKVLLEMQGSVDKSPNVRAEIFQRAREAVADRLAFNKSKAKDIRSGTYFIDPERQGAQPQGQSPVPAQSGKTVRFEDL